jgi:pimeloyl-ACP methyl ester carboxylesterase
LPSSKRNHRPETGVGFVQANGLRFATLEWGKGPLVLLLHGFPDTARTWDVIGPRIAAEGYRVVAPFSRGYAPTELPSKDVDARTLGEDVLALMSALGAEKARVIGHDWGAEASCAAVGLGPERFERLVTVGIPHRATVNITPLLAWRIRHFVVLRLPGAVVRFARNDFAGVAHLCSRWSPTWRFTPEDLEPVKNAFAAPGCLGAALGYYRAAEFRVPAFMRSRVAVPTLSIAGADDPNITPAAFEAARSQFSGRYEVAAIPGGHFCHREAPEKFLEVVLPFIR